MECVLKNASVMNRFYFRNYSLPLLQKRLSPQYVRSISNLPPTAQVVICGSGIVGNSIAYHLTQEGWTDVAVLEQSKSGSGTSSFGSGVVGLFREYSERWVASHSQQVLQKLQNEGHQIGLRKCGSINLAQTRERAIALKRRLAYMKPSGLQCEWVDRNRVLEIHPHLYNADLEGAVWFPEDSVADNQAVSNVLSSLAKENGVTYIENCEVLGVESETDLKSQVTPRVSSVKTSLGDIRCEYFVNASGLWARQVGENSKPHVRVPAFPAHHYLLSSLPMKEAADNLPIVRDYDNYCFCLTRNNQFILGGFEPRAKTVFEKGVPLDWREDLKPDNEHFQPTKYNVLRRIPLLQEAQFQPLVDVPAQFTPDGKWVLGETSEIDNYFVAVGMNGNALQGGVGAGLAVAQWIVHGSPPTLMLPFDVRRFIDLHNNRRYLMERTKEVVGRHYSIDYPYQTEFQLARRIRCSPIFLDLEKQGAVFGSIMGFEKPLYFDVSHTPGDPPAQLPAGTFFKPSYMHCVQEEYLACRVGVGILDISSFTKIEIKSAGLAKKKEFKMRDKRKDPESTDDQPYAENPVVAYMQKLSSSDVNVPVGGIVHTGMHNEKGGYENDGLLIRTSKNSYLMLAATLQETRIMDYMQRQINIETSVAVRDITSMYSVISVIGPKSKDMLSVLTNADLSFHQHKAKMVKIGYASDVLILAFTHVGEPGYTMIIPSEFAIHIYSNLLKVGRDYGAKNVGMKALKTLRVEKFIPFWAEEIDSTTNPFEIGRGYRVKLDKEYFIGKMALQQEQASGSRRRLVQFLMGDDYDAETELWPWGSEPIYRNGQHVGEITSAAFGFTLNRVVCLGWVHHEGKVVTPEYVLSPDAKYEIDIAGKLFSMTANLQAPKLPAASMDGLARSYRPKVRGIVQS